MSTPYTYYRPAADEQELSAYFAERLGLVRSVEEQPFPLQGDRWWVDTFTPDEDWSGEAARIGTDELLIITFEIGKNLVEDEYHRAHLDLFGAVVDQLNSTPKLTGMLVHGDEKVLIERSTGGLTMLAPSLADPGDYNFGDHLAPVLSRAAVAPLDDLG
ncbi:hypothetical protein [Glycomyces harbinensis]|uniref:Uncharacterized protein n=1 Tax=Glycomyces harbinensis TaxID=58114 RepID=A0A1G6RG82_9ACTN|nr:hypothetical protein [Glycomyces harbinensis]SDD03568.1 hypothetical protein SAMN05216270_101474 [Glycomyces harbinensis]